MVHSSVFACVFHCLFTMLGITFRTGKSHNHLQTTDHKDRENWVSDKKHLQFHNTSQLRSWNYFFQGAKHTSDVTQTYWIKRSLYICQQLSWLFLKLINNLLLKIFFIIKELQKLCFTSSAMNWPEGRRAWCTLGWGHRITRKSL